MQYLTKDSKKYVSNIICTLKNLRINKNETMANMQMMLYEELYRMNQKSPLPMYFVMMVVFIYEACNREDMLAKKATENKLLQNIYL